MPSPPTPKTSYARPSSRRCVLRRQARPCRRRCALAFPKVRDHRRADLGVARRTAGLEVFGPNLIRLASREQENTHGTSEKDIDRRRSEETAAVSLGGSSILKSMLHALASAGFVEVPTSSQRAWHVRGHGVGAPQGVETPRVLALVLPAGAWGRANADEVQMLSWTLPPPETPQDQYPQFADVKDADGKLEAFFDLAPGARIRSTGCRA